MSHAKHRLYTVLHRDIIFSRKLQCTALQTVWCDSRHCLSYCYCSLLWVRAHILFQCIVLNYYLLFFLFKEGAGKIK